jgi:aspartate/glutamate racemase
MDHNQKGPTIFIVHTSFVSVDTLTVLFREIGPEIQVRHLVDDSLLPEVLAYGGVTQHVTQRLCEYYKAAELAGAALILNQCSSVGEAAEVAAKEVHIPVIKIDAQMAVTACQAGRRIGVVATLETTLGPTCRLISRTAAHLGREIELNRCLVKGAFEVLMGGDRTRHNQMVLEAIRTLAPSVDVIVCAQGSMSAILPELGPTMVPVLTSPKLGVESAVAALRALRPDGNSFAAVGPAHGAC